MKHLDVDADAFIYLAGLAGWGPQKISIIGWISRTFDCFVRVGEIMARVNAKSWRE